MGAWVTPGGEILVWPLVRPCRALSISPYRIYGQPTGMEFISEKEWNDLSELKESFNVMNLESAVKNLIMEQGDAFEGSLFKFQFFLQAIKSCFEAYSESSAGGIYFILSASQLIYLYLLSNAFPILSNLITPVWFLDYQIAPSFWNWPQPAVRKTKVT